MTKKNETKADVKAETADVPDGFAKRLPAGPEYRIRVIRGELDKENGGKPFEVTNCHTGSCKAYAKVKLEGGSEMMFTAADPVCGSDGSARLVTTGSILVG